MADLFARKSMDMLVREAGDEEHGLKRAEQRANVSPRARNSVLPRQLESSEDGAVPCNGP